MPKPTVVPDTVATRLVRVPLMRIDACGPFDGVTEFDGTDGSDHPAPVRALTVNVYDVPFARPATSQDSADVRQVRPPGAEVTR